MTDTYHVSVEKDELVFSAAHFITFNGNICERLHGHNYRVRAHVSGELDENQYVIDFILLRDTLREITGQLDHRVLLPTTHEMISVEHTGHEVIAQFEDRRWVFPSEDCVLLPVTNTTAELLAQYIVDQLEERLRNKRGTLPQRISVAVEENFGQWATCERENAG